MKRLPRRLRAILLLATLLFPLFTLGYGTIAILGVRDSTAAAVRISADEFAAAYTTSQLGRQVDAAYLLARTRVADGTASARTPLDQQLFDYDVPGIDAAVLAVERAPTRSHAHSAKDIGRLASEWNALRSLLGPAPASESNASAVAYQQRLDAAYHVLIAHVDQLLNSDGADTKADQTRMLADRDQAMKIIAAVVLVGASTFCVIVIAGIREFRRTLEPARDQIKFAETLQLAGTEPEARDLLRRYLQRRLGGANVTVLNRNNSADRLEPVTPVAPESALTVSLRYAHPRSCLAIRSARAHEQAPGQNGLLACPVCSVCPGRSTCIPLTVGGEVIGSVLTNRKRAYSTSEQDGLRDAVSQAAPVLANLRNLAIAELRASTDSLTGLPNKRSVSDTLKRMLAQASRSMEPFSLVLLDLDHFKDINDTFGHPVGDQVLAGVGAAIGSALRDSDFAGRNGGEEFAILLPGTDVEGAQETAEKIRAAIADITLPGLDLFVTTSAGIASFPDHATGAEQLEQLADSALYVAKRSGRNRVEAATGSPNRAVAADRKN